MSSKSPAITHHDLDEGLREKGVVGVGGAVLERCGQITVIKG